MGSKLLAGLMLLSLVLAASCANVKNNHSYARHPVTEKKLAQKTHSAAHPNAAKWSK